MSLIHNLKYAALSAARNISALIAAKPLSFTVTEATFTHVVTSVTEGHTFINDGVITFKPLEWCKYEHSTSQFQAGLNFISGLNERPRDKTVEKTKSS